MNKQSSANARAAVLDKGVRRAAALALALTALPFLLCSVSPSTASAEDSAALAKRLAELRSEVEQLSNQLASKQQEAQDAVRSQARQKSELELELQREQTRLEKVRGSIAERKRDIEAQRASGDKLLPLFDKELAAIRQYVRESLPFRTDERLAELDKIEDQRHSGLLTPERAMMRLWTFIEDEFRMTRENGLYRQTIHLGDEEQLADVVRIGMVALYFHTNDERVGFVTRNGDGWKYEEVTGADDRRSVHDLFESFKKQIRVGYFEVPNAFPAVQTP